MPDSFRLKIKKMQLSMSVSIYSFKSHHFYLYDLKSF